MKMEKSLVLNEVRRSVAGRGGLVAKRQETLPDPNEVLLIHALLDSDEARAEIAPVLKQSTIVQRFASRGIFEAILRVIEAGENPGFANVEARLSDPDKERLAAMIFTDDTLTRDFAVEQALACIRKLASGERALQRDEIRRRIKEAERAGDMQLALSLMQQLSESQRG
jgi:hypothetical protein